MDAGPTQRTDRGFTLIELLIVIVILGVMATVVVFAVGGVTDRGEVAALASDAKTIETAEESHRAIHGTYASEDDLVARGFLREHSQLHDIEVAPDGSSYTLADHGTVTTTQAPDATTTTTIELPGPGEPGGPPLLAEEAEYAGQPGWSYGPEGSTKTLVIIGNGSGSAGQNLWNQITEAGLALSVDTQVIWMDQVSTRGQIDDILATGPTYVIVPIQVSLVGGGYAGQYISTEHHLDSPEQYWWGQAQGGVNGAIDYYLAEF